MEKKKIFIFEFVSGGGYNTVTIPTSLFCEGYSMLRSIIEDFTDLGFEVLTLLDKRIEFLAKYLRSNAIAFVDKNENYIEKYKNHLSKADNCFIIAPEFSNILYDLTEIAIDYEKKVYSIGLEGIKQGTSKMDTYDFFKRVKLPTPETYLIPISNNQLDFDFIYEKFLELNSSLIIKPEDGVGAESIIHINNEMKLQELQNTKKTSFKPSRNYILQRFVGGNDMSVSLIGSPNLKNNRPKILSINTQNVVLFKNNVESQYKGGMTPAINFNQINNLLEPILEKIDLSHFESYFGIDFIITPDNSFEFIEINPRLTTSYLGIRNIYNTNILNFIVNPKKFELIHALLHPNYLSEFYRLDLEYTGNQSAESLRNTYTPQILNRIPELVTPPIQLDGEGSDNYSCFIATQARNLNSSNHRKNQITKELKKFGFIPLDGN